MLSTPPLTLDFTANTPALHDRQVTVLERLTDMGMAIAEAIHREIEAGLVGEAEPGRRIAALNAAAVAHGRAARAVRLAIALQARLLAERRAADQALEEADDAKDPPRLIVSWLPPEPPRSTPDTIRREAATAETAAAIRDREPDDLSGLLRRPAGELIALICRDLGLDDDIAQRFQSAWTRAERDDPPAAHHPAPPPPPPYPEPPGAWPPTPRAGDCDPPDG